MHVDKQEKQKKTNNSDKKDLEEMAQFREKKKIQNEALKKVMNKINKKQK